MNVELTPVARAEIGRFFAMLGTYLAELDAYDPLGAEAGFLERYRAGILEDLDAGGGREIDWVVVDGERAGFLMTRTTEDWPHEERSVCTIAEFYVRPEQRRHGAGRAAVEALLARERARGTALVEAGVLRENGPALAFWQAMGFTVRSVTTVRRP